MNNERSNILLPCRVCISLVPRLSKAKVAIGGRIYGTPRYYRSVMHLVTPVFICYSLTSFTVLLPHLQKLAHVLLRGKISLCSNSSGDGLIFRGGHPKWEAWLRQAWVSPGPHYSRTAFQRHVCMSVVCLRSYTINVKFSHVTLTTFFAGGLL